MEICQATAIFKKSGTPERNGEKILKTTYWFRMNYVGNETPTPQTEEGITAVSWKNKDEIMNEVFPKTFNNIKLILNDYWEQI